MVQMFFMEIKKDGNMRRYVDVFQLMAGDLAEDPGTVFDIFQDIKGRNSDIACKNCIPSVFF